MKKSEDFDLTHFIIENVAGLALSLAVGVILFWLTLGSVIAYDGGIYTAGFTEISFILGVFVASALFGVRQKDILSAGILGFIIGLLTSLLEGFVLKLFWSPMTVWSIMSYWGNHIIILMFFGLLVSIGFHMFFSRKNHFF